MVDASERVAATRSRGRAKTAELAAVLSAATSDEVLATVAWLAGEDPVVDVSGSWRTLLPARPELFRGAIGTLTVADVDRALTDLTTIAGAGSAQRRKDALAAPRCRDGTRAAVPRPSHHRGAASGALEGVMTEAIAAASGVDATVVRRAVMLSCDLAQHGRRRDGRRRGRTARGRARRRTSHPTDAGRPARRWTRALDSLGPDVVVEYKLDAGIQVHRTGEDVVIATRTLRDITGSVPELVELVRDCRR